MDGVGELEAVDASGHLDVGKQKFDVGAGFEDGERVVGIGCFDRGVSGVLDDIHRSHAQQHLVFDDQNGGRNDGRNGKLTYNHDGLDLSSGANELARASCSLLASNVSANCP